ncbi:hypothetical protein FJU30_16900 [Affinibrenneria salicis]|uniref:Cation transporter n=1 Tax=Affinibrenneria salicis TaxID=2590031 RepID=A0A5J5FWP8_9GAMM|nr:hypothetical protein [Affinibrenneria salicis]KAA8998096.1 hypothetical protein FJU30_16900 [Affinibrenneria salicis]
MSVESYAGLLTLRRWVTIAHHIPGRVRLRFTNRLVMSLGERQLSALNDLCSDAGIIRQCQINRETGSLLLQYDAQRLSPALVDALFASEDEKAQDAFQRIVHLLNH